MRIIFAALVSTLLLTLPALAQTAIGFGGVTHDASQQIEIVSDGFTIDQATGNVVFAGNVIAVQGDLRLAAAEISVFYVDESGSQQVDQVIATGGVLLTRGDDAAEGNRAEYSVGDAAIFMTGDVLVTQGRTAISGDRLSIDLNTGNGTVDGRVRTVLQPSE